ncbi:hypothetical protein UCRNP2_3388 [Neofusicoccum parvum UCRNP2]|uniref:Uncharacterized protein n=1 Tax=Botryosphaeria parva (strain UCR-NP2) TaxID=1287680 RepID=R1GNF5_BOTPV|nr:hypothetical protein UCRNP2_3388 [Neofusicoccum parvum UCRNP2]
MPVIPGDPAAPATKRISVTTFFLVQKTVPKGPVSSKPLPGGYGAPFNPFGLPQPRWPVPIPRPSTFSIAAALSGGNENRGASTPVPKEADFAENDVETPTEPAAVETSADALSGSDSEEDHPPKKRVRITSPAAPQDRPTGTPRVAFAPMSSIMTVQTASTSAPKRTASTSPSPAPSPKKARPPQQLRRKVDTRSARQKRQDATVPTGKRAFHRTVDAAVAANPFPAAPPPKPPTPPQASSSGAAAASSSAAAAMPTSPGLYGGGSTVKYEDDFTTALKKEVMFRRANMEIDPPAEDFLD